MVVLKPNIVRGGRAIGLGNNLYLMKGRTHAKGGIDIGKNPKTGLEVENNEVMQVSPQGVRVFSAQPILGGISPAQYILGGANPNQVFNAQEQWKKINRINDDGTKKAKYGKEEIVAKRYNSAYRALIKNGYTDKDAERLVPFIISQNILESGYIDKDDNNYGGYLKNEKRIKYDSEEEFYSSHINNLKNKWPTIFNAKNIDDYLRIIHGGDIKEGNVWDYAPKEENNNYDNRVKSIYNKINNYINIYRKNYKNRDFITKLDPIEEQEFQKWYKSQAVVNGISLNPDDKEHYYDYRGFWKENRGKSNIGHFTDKYKIPGHPTFSEESVYSQPIVKGGKWNYINTPVKEEKFVPSNFNLNYKFGGRKIAQNGTERSRKKMFSNVTKQIKQIAKQEENRNTPLPIRGEKPITPLEYDVASYTPIVGDAIQLGEGISDIKNRNYLAGAINLGLLVLPNAIQGPVKKGIQSAVRKYEIKHLPGYQLKSLMEGNPLEKQLSKDGTLSVNSIKAISNKGSKVEKSVIDKVLDTKYAGKKSIDYNDFRKSIQDELIAYDRTPDRRWEDYGIDNIGIKRSEDLSELKNIENFAKSDRFEVVRTDTIGQAYLWLDKTTGDILNFDGITQRYLHGNKSKSGLNTYTFSSDRIPIGNARHYDTNTLGHSRTYTTSDEPDILHVMESQSDWAQSKGYKKPSEAWAIEQGKQTNRLMKKYIKEHPSNADWVYYDSNDNLNLPYEPDEILERDYPGITEYIKANLKPMPKRYVADDAMAERLHSDFTSRQIQENLRYAAERGQSKMRYPTRETAAKIEGYPVSEERLLDYDRGTIEYDAVKKELYEHPEYSPEHESILKKYSDFPKQYKKLFKSADVRTIIDTKGNSWYEVDVPQNYLNSEWQYKYGGIHIKPSKRGTFTAAAKKHGMSVQGFARKVLANKGKYSSAMIKKANFARNASKWKHKEFGGDMDFNYWITKDNIYKLGGRKKALNGTDYLKLLWEENSNIPKLRFSGLNVDIPEVPILSYPQRNNVSISNPTVKRDEIGLKDVSNRTKRIVNDALNNNSHLESTLQNTIDRNDALRTIASNQLKTNKNILGNIGNIGNLIGTGINIAGNLISYGINNRALNRMRRPSMPLPLRAENLQTRVSTAAQEAAIRENVAGQEGLISGNLASSRSRLNAINRVRNQGTSMYNQLQDRKQNIETELINRNKLNRQQIGNQNVLQFNNWRNIANEFDNRIIDLGSENGVNLSQGIADAIAGERGYIANRENDARYRMNAFLTTIANPDAFNAMNSAEIRRLARQFGITNRQLRDLGINV